MHRISEKTAKTTSTKDILRVLAIIKHQVGKNTVNAGVVVYNGLVHRRRAVD